MSFAIFVGTIHSRRIKGWLQNKWTISTRLHAKRYKFENNRRIRSQLTSANLQVTRAPVSCSLAPQNPSQLHNDRLLINKHCWPLHFNMTDSLLILNIKSCNAKQRRQRDRGTQRRSPQIKREKQTKKQSLDALDQNCEKQQ